MLVSGAAGTPHSRGPAARLLCLGEAFEDLIFVGLERLPQPGEEIRTNHFSATIGGGAVITAVAAARLGVNVTLASGLSAAAERRLKLEHLRIVNLRRDGEPHAVTAALSTDGDRAFVTFDGVNTRLEPRLAHVLRETRARHVHLALYPRNTRAWRRHVDALRRRGMTTSWDFGWNDMLAKDANLTALIDALTIVFVNEREAALYAGVRDVDAALPFWRARRCIVVIKLGPAGSRALSPAGEWAVPAPSITVVDTTGAGDAFNGGFLAAWLRGASVTQCLRAGNRIGAASTRRAGGLDALPRRTTQGAQAGRR
jgi:sugar/nucleoside kinase (ribokinase family)